MSKIGKIALAATASWIIGMQNASAANDSALLERIAKLEQELNLLKRQVEVQQEEKQSKEEKSAKVELGKKGLQISSPDNKYKFETHGVFQFDNRHFFDDENGTGKDEFLARRVRPILDFKAGDAFFRFMPDFGGGNTRVFEAYMEYALADNHSVKLGKSKVPLGLEYLQSDPDLWFNERSYVASFAPARDLGVQFQGDLLPNVLEYQVGVFNGAADLVNPDSDDDDKKDIAARLFAHPFSNSDIVALQGLGFGVGGSIGDREGNSGKTVLGDYRSPGQQTIFRYRTGAAATTAFASGTQWRVIPQAYWYWGNKGIMAEYGVSSQDVTIGTTSETLQHTAWQVQAGYVLTGENANFKGGVKPAEPFSLKEEGWGAWEVVGRLQQLDIDDDSFPVFASHAQSVDKAITYSGGINWYLNENLKLAMDYEFTQFDGGAATGDRPDEQALLTRAQVRF